MKKYFFGTFCIILFTYNLSAQNIRIGLLQNHNISSIRFSVLSGKYFLYGDSILLDSIDKSTELEITANDDSIEIHSETKKYGTFFKLYFQEDSTLEKNIFSVKSLIPKEYQRKYEGSLEINWNTCYLELINVLRLENYISGVIQSEAGRGQNREYDKVQAIICRTYALSNLQKHESQDFNLCDQQDCQVYNGMCSDTVITDAVKDTKGLVIVDADLNLIVAAFHSNCGGETLNSEDVWGMPTSYLKSVVDTFCIHQPNARWRKKISKISWNNYIEQQKKSFSTIPFDSLNSNSSLYFNDNGVQIPTKKIRSDWHLKSAYFSVLYLNDSVVELNGRGFGHRVGLCQEGAMEMSRLGYSFLHILHFYYTDVVIVHLSKINFFKSN